MADGDQIYSRCNDIPVVRHPSTASGDCTGLENAKIKAGQTSDWTLPAGSFKAQNVPQDYWQDEVSEVFVTTEDGELIELV